MFAIVTLNWNGFEDTLACLKSIEGLTCENVLAIVVDNASEGDQAKIIAKKYPRAVVLPQSENLGFCGGCNVGIRYALEHGAEWVMLLNNDTLIPNDLIEKLLSTASELENIAAISPVILEYPETEKVWFSDARWVAAEAQFRLTYPNERYDDIKKRAPYTSQFACGCCMLIPRSSLEKIGMLDERYFAFYDEAEWCSRARTMGLESYVVPSAFMYHKVSKSTPGLVSTYLLTRNRLLWMKENLTVVERLRSAQYLLRDFIWHSLNLGGLTKNYYTKDHSRAVLRGYKDYLLRKFYKWDSATEKIIFK